MRYSTPTCFKLRKEGESCRMLGGYSEPRNFTLSYPNGKVIYVKEAYTVICPCDASFGLQCVAGQCQQVSYFDTGNNL